MRRMLSFTAWHKVGMQLKLTRSSAGNCCCSGQAHGLASRTNNSRNQQVAALESRSMEGKHA